MAVKRDKIIANAEKLVAKGKIENAIKEYERLLVDNPSDVNTLNRVGDLWVRINRTDEAVSVFRDIANRYSKDGFFLKAIAIYKKINKLDPSRLEVYSELAELYAKQGLAMEAKSQYQVLADYHLKQGDPGNALEAYRKIAELDPNSINVHVKLADLYSQNGQVKEALEEYDRVGKMLLKRGMLDEALKVFRKALKIDPKNVDLAASLVDTLLEARDHDNAISLLESTLETNPGNPRLVALLGKTHLARGDATSAKSVLQAGLQASPTDLSIRTALADLHLKEGSPDDALHVLGPVAVSLAGKGDGSSVELLSRIIAIEPLHTPTLAKMVDAYKALNRETNVLASLNSLAEAYIAVQDYENASGALEELIEREPQNAQHKDKLAFVRKSLGVDVDGPADIVEEAEEIVEELPEIDEDVAIPQSDLVEPPDVDFAMSAPLDFGSGPDEAPVMEIEEASEGFGGDVVESPQIDEDVDFITEHLTEAEVFAKYGLAEKAIEHLESILSRSPDHLEANERLILISMDEGLKDKVCERATHLLGLLQTQGDDERFDRWFNDLIGRGFAVSPGPPVEVEVVAEGEPAEAAGPEITKPVPAVTEPEEVAEESEVTLDFDDAPSLDLEEPQEEVAALDFGEEAAEEEVAELEFGEEEPEEKVEEPEELAELEFGDEPDAVEEVAELDFGEEKAEEKVEEPDEAAAELDFGEEPAVEEEVAELDFGEEPAAEETVAELDFGEELAVEEKVAELEFGEEPAAEEEVAELDFGEEPAAEEEVAELDFGEEPAAEEEVAEIDFGEEPAAEEEVAELDFGEEPAVEEEVAELDFGEEETTVEPELEPEPLPELEPEPLAASDAGLDFEPAESTALGGPAVEEIGELDFYIEQELYDEARTKVNALLEQFPVAEELLERKNRIDEATAPPPAPAPTFSAEDIESELLAAIPEDDEDIEIHAQEAVAAAEPLIDEGDLFAEEDDFFDLASELEDELLDDDEPISLAEEEQSLEDIFKEFKKGVEQQLDSEDYDTHYNLGIAYKEMGLIDEAIGEFQVASKDPGKMIECCSMLGLCFLEKGMPQLAVKWYKKGLESPEIKEEENLGLLYDLGSAHLESGDTASAQKAFMEVYGANSNYRDIVSKIKQIEEAKK